MWLKTIHLGIRNLLLHKLRSLLTMLGTILGVASVIAMLAIGEGSKREAVEQIRQLGARNIIIRSVKPDGSESDGGGAVSGTNQTSRVVEYGLKYSDFDRLMSAIPTIEDATPAAVIRKNTSRNRFRIDNARIVGTTPNYLNAKNLSVKSGRFIVESDLERFANVVVLGAASARRLFGFEDALEQKVLIGKGAYTVVGILEPQGSVINASGAATPQSSERNNDIIIPLSAAQSRFGELQMIVRAGSRDYERTQLGEIILMVEDESHVSQTASMALKLLQRSHPKSNDFEIQVPLELLKKAEQEKRIWNLVLGSIAGISLLVGGIGIMNIMLATVTERTREIGIRRALGAKRSDIVTQFLVETFVLSASGGLLGVSLGVIIPIIVTSVSKIQTVVSYWAVLVSFLVAVLTGILFGVYPARRAAMLDPIEALRHE